MKRIIVAVAALAVLAVGSARAADPAAAELFQKKCAVCHGKDGKGATPMAQKLGAKDLTTLKESEGDIAKVISDGKGKMTPFKGKLTDAEIASLAKYVKEGLK
jgi:cytochrome c6